MSLKKIMNLIQSFWKWEELFFLKEKSINFVGNYKIDEVIKKIDHFSKSNHSFRKAFKMDIKKNAIYIKKYRVFGLYPSVHYYKGNIIIEDQCIKITGRYKIHPILKIFVLLWANGHMALVCTSLAVALIALSRSLSEGTQIVPVEPFAFVGFSVFTFLLAFFLFRLMYIGDNPKHVIDYMSNIGLKPEL
jgi:hypothetical protein